MEPLASEVSPLHSLKNVNMGRSVMKDRGTGWYVNDAARNNAKSYENRKTIVLSVGWLKEWSIDVEDKI